MKEEAKGKPLTEQSLRTIIREEVKEGVKHLATQESVDNLAMSVANQFGEVDKQFTEVTEQFAGVTEQFKKVHQRFDDLEQKVGGQANKAFEDRTEVSTVVRKIVKLDERVTRLEAHPA